MSPLRTAAAERADGGDCARCRTSTGEIRWSEEHRSWLCESCFHASASPTETQQSSVSSETGSPQSSVLDPCPTPPPGDLGEVEALLAAHAAGRWQPAPVELPPLAPSATSAMHRVADFFALVLGLRKSVGREDGVPFSLRWVQSHTGLPRESVSRALRSLVAAGVLLPAEVLPPRGHPRGTQCYRPGSVVGGEVDELAERRRSRRGGKGASDG